MAANTAPTFTIGDATVITQLAGTTSDTAFGVVLQSDGKIVAAGQARVDSTYDFGVVRYNTDGTLDATFSSDGMVTTAVGSGDDIGRAVVVQADGKIIVAGSAVIGGAADFALVRYNPDGSVDTSFGTNGLVTTAIGAGEDLARSVVLQADGKIVLAGSSYNGSNYDIAVVRYNANGTLDTTFDGDGKVTTAIGPADDEGMDVVLQSDGKIVVAGRSDTGDNTNNTSLRNDFALVRFNANGSLDTTFSGDGKLSHSFGPGSDAYGTAVALQGDGKIVVGGYDTTSTAGTQFVAARYNGDGTVDTSFGGDGVADKPTGNGGVMQANDVLVQPDGKVVLAGAANGRDSTTFMLDRINADGTQDTSFGQNGVVNTLVIPSGSNKSIAYGIVLQSDGKLVAAGTTFDNQRPTPPAFALVRYNANGSLDLGFDAANTLNNNPTAPSNGSPVQLDPTVQIYDAELSAANSFGGARVTLARHGGASSDDLFSVQRTQTGSNFTDGGVAYGTVTLNTGGTLIIDFNANATQQRVNDTLSAIFYRNALGTPPGSVQIDWTFSDGNTGAQGTGGALSATGSIVVRLGDAPTINGTSGNDTLNGTSLGETITGFAGDDVIIGNGGPDLLRGGSTTPTGFNTNGALARLADFDGDHDSDILQIDANGGMRVWLWNGSSWGGQPNWWGDGSRPIDQIADVNGDGRADVVELHENGKMYVWTSTGTAFKPYEVWGFSSRPQDKLADVNGDGRADVVELHESGRIFVWTSTGTGFNSYQVWGTGSRPQDQLADVNGDGRMDVVQPHENGNIYVWTSNGTSFNPYVVWGNGSRPQDKLADVNGDGRADLVEMHENGKIYVWTSNGTSFDPYTVWGHDARPEDKLADVNADGRADIVELNENGEIYVWLSTGTAFGARQLWGHGVRPNDQLADVQGDGRTDVVQLHENGNAYAFLSNGVSFNLDGVSGTGAPDGGGNDTFVFGPGFGRDTVRDFTPGSAGGDVLQFHDVFTSYSDVMSHAVDDGNGNTVITFDANNTILLEHVLRSLLVPADMSFV